MQVEWYGQSSLRPADRSTAVLVGRFTHEHLDHSGVETVDGDPTQDALAGADAG